MKENMCGGCVRDARQVYKCVMWSDRQQVCGVLTDDSPPQPEVADKYTVRVEVTRVSDNDIRLGESTFASVVMTLYTFSSSCTFLVGKGVRG